MAAAGQPCSRNRIVVGATARINVSSTPVPPAPVTTWPGEAPSSAATTSANGSAYAQGYSDGSAAPAAPDPAAASTSSAAGWAPHRLRLSLRSTATGERLGR